ncbi:nitrilase-related carbon-nitrogen hydrolase [Streptomyces xanthophaeus]|uniref:nitrilase-related carbon-nitrogen hydrolase n=1 Tax=Streptomyces xanthophaeus TaxID=67385 RepID=UPI0034340592
MWEHAISANGLANALFMIVPNRVGTEGRSTFYGSSFISDPYGRDLAAPPAGEARRLHAPPPGAGTVWRGNDRAPGHGTVRDSALWFVTARRGEAGATGRSHRRAE